MADDIVTIDVGTGTFADSEGDQARYSGTITVNYTAGTASGNFEVDGINGNGFGNGGDFNNRTLQRNGDDGYTAGGQDFFVIYNGRTPSTAEIRYYKNDDDIYDTRGVSVTSTVNSGTVCFASGTRIRVVSTHIESDVAVESLKVGDMVVTASGAHRPIRWIGHRAYAARFANANAGLLPVCVKADALADAVPARDLWVSPKHALFLDGVLVPAAALVNGVSIVQATAVDGDLVYWHVELDGHDVLLAENVPAESFVDDEGRAIFHNADTFRALYPDAAETEAVYCAPRVEGGHRLAAVRERVDARAGCAPAEAPAFGLLLGRLDACDGLQVRGWARDDLHPDAPVCLDVLVDGAVVALTYADAYRPDLEAAGIGDGCHGFALDLPLEPGRAHVVAVRRSADGAALAGSPWQVPARAARAA